MASGDTLVVFGPLSNEPAVTTFATVDSRNGHVVLDFDAATDETAIFSAVLPRNYAGGGLTCSLRWAATSATSGNVVWTTEIERIDDGVLDIDADSFAATSSVTDAASGTSGVTKYSTTTHTSGAQMDSLAAGEMFRLRVTRVGSNGSDTMTGDAELLAVEIKET